MIPALEKCKPAYNKQFVLVSAAHTHAFVSKCTTCGACKKQRGDSNMWEENMGGAGAMGKQ